MKKVKYYQVQIWFWDCPNCGQLNEFTMDPSEVSELSCGSCKDVFELIDASQPNIQADAECRCGGKWRTDGQHSNEFCSVCFKTRTA